MTKSSFSPSKEKHNINSNNRLTFHRINNFITLNGRFISFQSFTVKHQNENTNYKNQTELQKSKFKI